MSNFKKQMMRGAAERLWSMAKDMDRRTYTEDYHGIAMLVLQSEDQLALIKSALVSISEFVPKAHQEETADAG